MKGERGDSKRRSSRRISVGSVPLLTRRLLCLIFVLAAEHIPVPFTRCAAPGVPGQRLWRPWESERPELPANDPMPELPANDPVPEPQAVQQNAERPAVRPGEGRAQKENHDPIMILLGVMLSTTELGEGPASNTAGWGARGLSRLMRRVAVYREDRGFIPRPFAPVITSEERKLLNRYSHIMMHSLISTSLRYDAGIQRIRKREEAERARRFNRRRNRPYEAEIQTTTRKNIWKSLLQRYERARQRLALRMLNILPPLSPQPLPLKGGCKGGCHTTPIAKVGLTNQPSASTAQNAQHTAPVWSPSAPRPTSFFPRSPDTEGPRAEG